MKGSLLIILAATAVILCYGCSDQNLKLSNQNRLFSKSLPEEQGMDSTRLIAMLKKIKKDKKKLTSLIVMRNNKMVLEEYFNNHSPNSLNQIWSVTKSIMSFLIGKAIDEGHIQSVHDSIEKYLGDYFKLNIIDKNKKRKITIEHLLTMTSGFKWVEIGQEKGKSSFHKMTATRDWIKHILKTPMLNNPGTGFNYCSGNSHLLSAILQRTTGKSAFQYAMEKLFKPLGINKVKWDKDPQGRSIGALGLRLTSRDMVKIGLLYLNQGRWQGTPIISKQWIKKSTQGYASFNGWKYGYKWWLISNAPYKIYSAIGSLGQFISVVPKLNMVIVVTANLSPKENIAYIPQLMEKYIIKSVID